MKYVIQFTFPNKKKKYLAPGIFTTECFDENPYRAYTYTLENARHVCRELEKEYSDSDKNCVIEIVKILSHKV